tara:strand:+ start:61 stop:534 length:474 start_codon:yes stop_codon:yes gene_type:complete
MNRGNPHKRESFLGPLNNRGMGRDRREKPVYKPGPYLDGQETIYKSLPFPRGQETIYRPLTAGYDNGNTRVPNTMPPIGGPFVPFGGMDYTGKNTGMRMASMDPGSKYNGTYKQPGYADPRFDDYGQEEYYDNRDYYMDDVIDPGLSGYDRGPLYFS